MIRHSHAVVAAFVVAVTSLSSGGAALQAQAASASSAMISAPLKDVRYEVTFTHATAAQRSIDVAMTFTTSGAGPVLLSLPAWTPGAYEISNFARWLTGFTATGDGHTLTWDKVDYDTWRVRSAGAKSIRVSFRYAADSLDNAMAWARPDFLLFNGTNLFLYPEGQTLEYVSTVAVHTEPEWRVTTAMPIGRTPGTFTAGNYHDLVDMPFMIGKYDLDSTRIADRWVRLASYPAAAIGGATRETVWIQLKKVIPPEVAVFGEAPWGSYTVMAIVDSSFMGASGLEHQSSHVDVLNPSYLGTDFQPSLFAHEIFHSWNVKRLRPAEMWPYEYSHPQPTPWLWVSEGITDYYADLAEVRSGVADDKGFFAMTAAKINEVIATSPTALTDASLSTWIHPIDGSEYLYYPKGSLAGFMLDILIRDASDNASSLYDVMRGLYQATYKQGRGFTSVEWWNAVSSAAKGKSFASFNERFIDGREAFPWDSILPLAGLRAHQERVPRLGVTTMQDANGVIVSGVQPGSAAAAAGVNTGDYLLTVGDIAVDDQMFGAKLRAKYASTPEGTPLQIKIRRGGQPVVLAGKLQFAPGDLVIEANPSASAKAVRIRNGILRGR